MASGIPEMAEPAAAKAALAKLWRERQYQEAASLAAKATELWPQDPAFALEHAKSLLAVGALAEAEAAARAALATDASAAEKEEIWLILTDSLIRQERQADGREALREACFAQPESVALQGRRGHQAMLAKDYAETIDAYQIACDLAPERDALHHGLLSGLWHAKRYALGSAAAERAVQLMPQSAALRQQLASFLLAERRTAEAAEVARAALALDPTLSASYWTLVSALWAEERQTAALKELVAACERLPKDAFLLMQLGRTANIMSQPELAVRGYELAIENPDAPEIAWVGLVKTLIELNRLSEAYSVAARGVVGRPDIDELRHLFAEVLIRQEKDMATVAAALSETLELPASAPAIRDAIIGALMRLGRWSEALEMLDELRALAPKEPEIAVKYARALTGFGAVVKAEELLKQILGDNPDFVPAWRCLCESLRLQKRIKEALAAYRRMEALGAPSNELRETRYDLFGEYD